MKKIQGTILMAILAAALVALGACANSLDAPLPEREAETGTVHIAIDGAGDSAAARTLGPATANFTRYMASFSGPESHDDISVQGNSAWVDLAPGDWTITVTAYSGAEPYNEAGRGSATLRVESGEQATAAITITPITEGGRTGTFRYSVTLPLPPADSATLILANALTGSTVRTVDLQETTGSGTLTDLAAGYYRMYIRLEKGGIYAGRTEVVHIYPGMETLADYTFTADSDFPLGLSLTDGVWQNTELTTNAAHYYRFPVTAGKTYVVSWNDRDDGDGTKGLNIKVSAYYEAGLVSIFGPQDSGYNAPRSFTPASNGNVILEVEPDYYGNFGTYGLIYIDNDAVKDGQVVAFRSSHSILDKTTETIAAADEPDVDFALSDYGNRSDALKVLLITEKAHLDSLKARINQLKALAQTFRSVHGDILEKTVGTIAIADEAAVDAALDDHDDLIDAVKAILTADKTLLDNLQTKIGELKEEAADGFRDTHGDILSKTVETVVIADETDVDAALTAYDDLPDTVQALLTDARDLLESLAARIATLGTGSVTLVYPTVDVADTALTYDSIVIYKTGEPQSHTLTVDDDFDRYRWRVDGSLRGSGKNFTLAADDYAEGIHQISLEVILNGVVYSKSGAFTVAP